MSRFLEKGLLLLKIPESVVWIVEICLVLALTVLASYFFRHLYIFLHRKLRSTRNSWDTAISLALRKPAMLAIWIIGIFYIVNIVAEETQISLFNEINKLKVIVFSFGFLWFVFRLTNHMTKVLIVKHKKIGRTIDLTTADAIAKIIKIMVTVVVLLSLLDYVGVSLSGILAFGGFSGIAIGFAAKDLLSNVFGALVIYMDKPFSVGDWIQSPDRDVQGTVEYIGWRQTRLRSFDKRPIYVPNSILGTIIIENPSRMSFRRIDENIGIRYEDASKILDIVTDIKNMLIEHPEIKSSQTLFVTFDRFSEYSLNIKIYGFTKTINWVRYQEIKQDIFLKSIDIIESHGAKVALPNSIIKIKDKVNLDMNRGSEEEIVTMYHQDENGHAH